MCLSVDLRPMPATRLLLRALSTRTNEEWKECGGQVMRWQRGMIASTAKLNRVVRFKLIG